jgi:hypothetical protein
MRPADAQEASQGHTAGVDNGVVVKSTRVASGQGKREEFQGHRRCSHHCIGVYYCMAEDPRYATVAMLPTCCYCSAVKRGWEHHLASLGGKKASLNLWYLEHVTVKAERIPKQ